MRGKAGELQRSLEFRPTGSVVAKEMPRYFGRTLMCSSFTTVRDQHPRNFDQDFPGV